MRSSQAGGASEGEAERTGPSGGDATRLRAHSQCSEQSKAGAAMPVVGWYINKPAPSAESNEWRPRCTGRPATPPRSSGDSHCGHLPPSDSRQCPFLFVACSPLCSLARAPLSTTVPCRLLLLSGWCLLGDSAASRFAVAPLLQRPTEVKWLDWSGLHEPSRSHSPDKTQARVAARGAHDTTVSRWATTLTRTELAPPSALAAAISLACPPTSMPSTISRRRRRLMCRAFP